jgi:DNA-binding NtrC family response regulator
MNTKEVHAIHPKVINALINYSWPGNIRELENLIERAYILETSNELNPDSFPTDLMETDSISTGGSRDPYLSLAQVRKKGIEDIERTYLRELLARNNGKIRTSAEVAGITTRQLHKLMVKYGLKKETFK